MNSQDHPTESLCEKRSRFAGLSLREIFIPILMLLVVGPVIGSMVRLSGIPQKYYGPELISLTEQPKESREREIARARLSLWSTGIVLPLMALAFPFFFKQQAKITWEEMGWTGRGFSKGLIIGIFGALALIPIVYFVQWGVIQLHNQLSTTILVEHPLAHFAGEPIRGLEWGLLILTAGIGAPILEEQIFRGVLQPWFSAKPKGGSYSLAAAAFISLVQNLATWKQLMTSFIHGPFQWQAEFWKAILPIIFLCIPLIFVFCFEYYSKANIAGLIGTAVLFGMIHGFAWPSPIGLSILGIGLGFVYFKTKNLMAPILIHGLFNSLGLVLLAIQA